jgi:hypothetical protein
VLGSVGVGREPGGEERADLDDRMKAFESVFVVSLAEENLSIFQKGEDCLRGYSVTVGHVGPLEPVSGNTESGDLLLGHIRPYRGRASTLSDDWNGLCSSCDPSSNADVRVAPGRRRSAGHNQVSPLPRSVLGQEPQFFGLPGVPEGDRGRLVAIDS